MYEDTKTESLYNNHDEKSQSHGYLTSGTVLSGKYRIEGILGHGGFGITYKAWDTVLENYVAIKEYYPASIANRGVDGKSISVMTQNDKKEFDEGVERFLREARDVSKFNSYNNIVSIHDFFEENDTAYMVMEYLEGKTLKEYMDDNNTIDESMQLHIAFSILEVLKTIHSKGIIHRDISPDNIFICSNFNIKLIDFGAAKNDTQNDARTVSVVLKKGYAPIEQYSAKSIVSPKVDIYAFGATMYYLLTRTMPVPSVDRVINDDLVEPKKLNPNISDEWNKVILKCMQIKAEDRYNSAEEIQKDLMGKGNDAEGKHDKQADIKKNDEEEKADILSEDVFIINSVDDDKSSIIKKSGNFFNDSNFKVIIVVLLLIVVGAVIKKISDSSNKKADNNDSHSTEIANTEAIKDDDSSLGTQTPDNTSIGTYDNNSGYHLEVTGIGYLSGGASLFGASYSEISNKLNYIFMTPINVEMYMDVYGDLNKNILANHLINEEEYDFDVEIYYNQTYENGTLFYFFKDGKLMECTYVTKKINVQPEEIVSFAINDLGSQNMIDNNAEFNSYIEFEPNCYYISYLTEDAKTGTEYYIQDYTKVN